MDNPRGGPGRSASRFATGLPAVARYRGHEYACRAHNLSRTGLLLVGEIPWPSETEIELTVRTVAGDLELRAKGVIKHIAAETEDVETHIGLEFTELEESQRAVLEALVSRVIGGQLPAPIEALAKDASDAQIQEALALVPVGQRVALASRAGLRERELLSSDPNPQVLEALARNPGLLKHEAVALLRLSNLLPTTLELLARDPKWARDEGIKVAICTHPRASFALAEKLLATLSPLALRDALQRPGLNPDLRVRLSLAAKKPPRRRR